MQILRKNNQDKVNIKIFSSRTKKGFKKKFQKLGLKQNLLKNYRKCQEDPKNPKIVKKRKGWIKKTDWGQDKGYSNIFFKKSSRRKEKSYGS